VFWFSSAFPSTFSEIFYLNTLALKLIALLVVTIEIVVVVTVVACTYCLLTQLNNPFEIETPQVLGLQLNHLSAIVDNTCLYHNGDISRF
jgi:hypothetical protein